MLVDVDHSQLMSVKKGRLKTYVYCHSNLTPGRQAKMNGWN